MHENKKSNYQKAVKRSTFPKIAHFYNLWYSMTTIFQVNPISQEPIVT